MDKFIQFQKGLDKHITKTFCSLLKQSEAENQVLISKLLEIESSDFEDDKVKNIEIRTSIPKIFKFDDLGKYCILSWYMPLEMRFYLQTFLEERCIKLKYFELKELLLNSKEIMLATLFTETLWKKNHLFGNILQRGVWINTYFTDSEKLSKKRIKRSDFVCILALPPKKAKATIFRRGYKDKGSLPPWDKKARQEAMEYNYQNEIERELIVLQRQILASTKLLEVQKFLQGCSI